MTDLYPPAALLQGINPSQFNNFLLLAYAVMWLIFIVYVAYLVNKQRNLHQDIKLMERLLEEDEGDNGK